MVTPNFDDQRCPPPASFLALYAIGRSRYSEPMDRLMERHDLCENLAQQLAAATRPAMVNDGLSLADLLPRCQQVLADPDIGLSQAESGWVLERLAELAD